MMDGEGGDDAVKTSWFETECVAEDVGGVGSKTAVSTPSKFAFTSAEEILPPRVVSMTFSISAIVA
ncbi:MAG: hypothetical protein CSA11_08755 [Chloroflexi bacterium]|nr:MAG: hypothetical protein CSA11_08755 [Chloroflexota bacterium]